VPVPPTVHRVQRHLHAQVMEYLGNLFNLEGRVAMVSGATGGVGKALCLALAR
jgi:hypothetical protein